MPRQPLQTTSQLPIPDIKDLPTDHPLRQLTQASSQQNTKIYNDLNLLFNSIGQNTGAIYFGDPLTNGTWRIITSGNNLSVQRRESGAYVEKFSFTP